MAEPHAEAALEVLDSGADLVAPAHWLSEAANAVWAAARRGDLIEQEAEERTATLAEAPVATVPLNRLVAAAMAIGLRIGVTIYDALYLALAVERSGVLVTDDRRLLAAARSDSHLRDRVKWIGDSSARDLFRGPHEH